MKNILLFTKIPMLAMMSMFLGFKDPYKYVCVCVCVYVYVCVCL